MLMRWVRLLHAQVLFRRVLHAALRAVDPSVKARAVATPVADLTALLVRRRRARHSHAQLECVARALHNREGLDTVPGTVLHAAAEQLDRLISTSEPQAPGLGVLRLQMRRQILADAARNAIARSGTPMNWHPSHEPARHPPPPRDYTPLLASDSQGPVAIDAQDTEDADDTACAPAVFGALTSRSCLYQDTVASGDCDSAGSHRA
ncbi:MAG: hypothetical protein KGK18_00470 [Burkholderiales bacterium]|nr:hypothetical protein [Burkholderiales bacterium]